jgi:multicomponent Na+:H+ antiporter subunit C
MSDFVLYGLASAVLFSIGLYGFLFHENLIRKLLALNIMGGSVFVLLGAVSHRNAAPDPDPVPQAMVLTGIVVAVSATALALAIARRIEAETGAPALPEETESE